MRKVYLILFVFTSCFSFSQKTQEDYTKIIDKLLFDRTKNYDSIHEQLKTFSADTLIMNYLIEKSKKIKYLEGESYGLHGKGTFFANRRIYHLADSLHQQGFTLAEKADNIILQILHLNKLGALNKRTEKVRTAIDYYQKSLEIAESTDQNSYEFLTNYGRTKNSIGSVYLILQQYEKSIEYFNEAIAIQQKINNKNRLAVNNQNLGVAYENLGFLDKAFSYYEKALQYDIDIASDFGIIISKNSMAQIFIKKGEHKKAEALIKPLIPQIRKTEYPLHITSVILNYGWAHLNLNNFESAERFLKEGLEIAKEFKLQNHIVKAHLLLSELEEKKGNYSKALSLYKIAKEQNEKVINQQNNRYINDLSFKYDVERKNIQLKTLENNNKIIGLKLQQNKTLTILIVSTLLVFSSLLFLNFRQMQKRKTQEILTLKREQQVQTLELLMEGEEKERLRIAKELHDGVNVDLSAIKYKLTSMLEKNNEVINEAVQMIDKSCEQVRAISHNLVPPSLKDFSLLETIEDFCTTSNSLHAPEITFNHIGDPIHITKKAEVNIFRIVQELVNNSIKHAEATEVNVQISHRDNTIQLTVEDNGVGFNKENSTRKGIGLQNVQSRVEYLNAKLDFNSNDEGTSYIIDMNTDELT